MAERFASVTRLQGPDDVPQNSGYGHEGHDPDEDSSARFHVVPSFCRSAPGGEEILYFTECLASARRESVPNLGSQLRNLLLQITQSPNHLRQLLHTDPLPLGLFVRRRRDAEHPTAVRHVAHHA